MRAVDRPLNRCGTEHSSTGLPSNPFHQRFSTRTTMRIAGNCHLLSPSTSAICNTISASWPTPEHENRRCWYSGFVAHRDRRHLAGGAGYIESRRHAADADTEDQVPSSLELVVTSVATQLMGVNAATSVEVSQRVLADLVEYFDVDVSFLRRNDHRILH